MKIGAEQLPAWLARVKASLPPLIWVAGDETLIVQESCDLIRRAARAQQFTEREIHHVDRNFDWQQLQYSSQHLSLFAQKRLIELRLTSGKLEEAGRKALLSHLAHASQDMLILISSPRLDASAGRSKWFTTLEGAAAIIQVWPIDSRQLPAWLQRRLQAHGLNADADAIALLSDRTQGNLLAANQEVEKLAMMCLPDQTQVSVETVLNSVADNARFNVFQLVDQALSGRTADALRSLHALLAEGSEVLLLLLMISRELRTLGRMRAAMAEGQSTTAVMKAERVWQNRQVVVSRALQRLDSTQLQQLLRMARDVDLAVKGLHCLPPALLLEQLILALSGVTLRFPYDQAPQPAHA